MRSVILGYVHPSELIEYVKEEWDYESHPKDLFQQMPDPVKGLDAFFLERTLLTDMGFDRIEPQSSISPLYESDHVCLYDLGRKEWLCWDNTPY